MQEVIALLTRIGVPLPDDLNWLAVAIGLFFVGTGTAIGWVISRWAGQHLAGFWDKAVGDRAEGLSARMVRIIYHATVSIVLAIAFFAMDWWTFTDLVIGAGWGLCAGYLVWHIARAINFSRWISLTVGLFTFGVILSNAVGGLERVTFVFDRIGVTVGSTRISLLTVMIIVITALALFAVVRIMRRVISHSIQSSSGLDPAQKLLADKLATVVIMAAAFFIGIDILGIDLTALAFFSGALGLAVGFGMQKTVGNLIAGIILLMDRSIKPGDVIAVGESFGWVNKIGVRAVSIITRDGKEHLIPNENLMTEEVENWSYSSLEVRVHIEVGVSYNCDIRLAQELMVEAALDAPRVLKSPKPKTLLFEFGDSSVNFDVRVWIKDPEEGVANVRSEILNRIWWKFKENDIEIPFPQRDLHIKEWPEGKPMALAGDDIAASAPVAPPKPGAS
ncbi:mechanosensitive ion channel family protein [Parasphingopyxis lamellibrachiae]|uniref:Mechanosensitive ion channel-like protein n=1 Tax=Parasphingopyxis lamellibrachiae TaxID=680125 RepID=A0A3D9FEH9_9SPHN|nr:mechanosensitive ion channel domain-containing protein [Parasphingopyxis lamellibrachiae]RED16244.1 mechanosensitive ion channel-like protein [Parasphingopyxis lamellibrachiae]